MSSTTSDVAARDFLQSLDSQRRGQTEAIVIRAGAGAGKTTELVKRVLSLILQFRQQEKRFPRLVVTTFTRKATQELRERLLLGALQLNDPEVLRFVQQSKSLQISTIHGTLRRFLSAFGPAAGLSPEFRIMDAVSDARLRQRCLRQLLEDPAFSEGFEKLLENWDLSAFWTAFFAWSEHQIFHPEAYPETAADVEAAIQQKLNALLVLARSLVEMAGSEKLTPNRQQFVAWVSAIVTVAAKAPVQDQRAIWLEALEELPRSAVSKDMSDSFKETQKELYTAWKEIAEPEFAPEFLRDYANNLEHFLPLAKALFDKIEDEKSRRSELSLTDLELWTLKILKTNPESGQKFGEQWDYWMIDEFQDTSPLQVEILKGLVGDRNEFVVGDPQQSIYLFRGARSEVFALKEQQVLASGGKNDQLMTNYRSSPKTMNFLNRFLTELEPKQFAPMNIGGSSEKDFAGPQAVFWGLPDDSLQDECDLILGRVQELLSQGVAAEKICVLGRGNAPLQDFCQRAKDFGVPTRFSGAAGFAERREVRDALAFLRFLVNPHDNLNLLTLLRSPWFKVEDRGLAQLHKLRGHSRVSYWQAVLKYLSDSQTPEQQSAAEGDGFKIEEAALANLRTLVKSLQRAEQQGLTQAWVLDLLDRGFIDQSLVLDSSGQRESHFWRLVADLKFQEREAGFNIIKWIEQIEIGQVTDEKVDAEAPAVIEPSRVQVMTIHASKGLQFEHVIVGWAGRARFAAAAGPLKADETTGRFSLGVRCADTGQWLNSFWAQDLMQIVKQREIQEFDRFLYVAMTRAIQTVTLVWSKPVKNSWMSRRPPWTSLPDGVHKIADTEPHFEIEIRSSEPALQQLSQHILQSDSVRPLWRPAIISQPTPRGPSASSGWSRFEKIQTGVDIHRSLELLQSDWDFDDSVEMQNVKNRLDQVHEVSMKDLIQQGFVEWAFMVKIPSQAAASDAVPETWFSGRIDLWGVLPGVAGSHPQVWIVDYKTGSSKSRDKALTQLKIYAWTLYQMKRIPELAEVRLLPLYLNELAATKAELCVAFQDLDQQIHQLMATYHNANL